MLNFLRKYYQHFFLLALVFRVENILLFSGMNIDKAIQLAATFNFKHGHGILLSMANVSELLKIEYIPFYGWPPGFTLLLTPLYLLVDNLILVNRLMDVFFIILFFFASRSIINRLFENQRKEILAIFCLLSTFSFSPYYYYTSTDLYALTIFVVSLSPIYDLVKGIKKGMLQSFLIAFLLCLSTAIRFAYLPLALIIPFVLILIGRKDNNSSLVKNSFFTLLFSIVMVSGLYLFQKYYYGSGSYLEHSKFALHPENLLQTDPFIFKTYFFIDTFVAKINSHNILKIAMLSFEIIISSFILLFFIKDIYTRRLEKSTLFNFEILALTVLLVVCGMLTFLSLISPTQSFTGQSSWTYVKETRYYAPAIFFIQLFVSKMIFNPNKRSLTLLFKTFAIFSFSISIIYFSFKHYKLIVKHDREGTFNYDLKEPLELLQILKKSNQDLQPIIVATKNETMSTLSILSNGIPVSNYDSLLVHGAQLPTDKIIYLECEQPLNNSQKLFLSQTKSNFIFSLGKNNWYLIKSK